MSTETPTAYPHTPAPKKKRRPSKAIILSTAAGVLVGALIGAGPTPEPQVITETKTVTKEVEVQAPLPQSCIRAFQQGEEVMDKYGQVGQLASDSIGAAYDRNGPLMESIGEEVKTLSQQVTTQAGVYGTAKGQCSKDTGTEIPFLPNY